MCLQTGPRLNMSPAARHDLSRLQLPAMTSLSMTSLSMTSLSMTSLSLSSTTVLRRRAQLRRRLAAASQADPRCRLINHAVFTTAQRKWKLRSQKRLADLPIHNSAQPKKGSGSPLERVLLMKMLFL